MYRKLNPSGTCTLRLFVMVYCCRGPFCTGKWHRCRCRGPRRKGSSRGPRHTFLCHVNLEAGCHVNPREGCGLAGWGTGPPVPVTTCSHMGLHSGAMWCTASQRDVVGLPYPDHAVLQVLGTAGGTPAGVGEGGPVVAAVWMVALVVAHVDHARRGMERAPGGPLAGVAEGGPFSAKRLVTNAHVCTGKV